MDSELIQSENCSGKQCGYGITKDAVGCSQGPGSCFTAAMLVATESEFHDKTLYDAAQQINAILNAIPADPKGRKLSFLATQEGAMLAWVDHNMQIPPDAVKPDAPFETIAKALGVVGYAADAAEQKGV
jgi:hypothetical protein